MTDIYIPFNNPSQIVKYSSNLRFKVYYLEAPLSILSETIINIDSDFKSLLSVNGYHTGIGFQCTDVTQEYELTFDETAGEQSFLQTLLPTIVNNNVIWNNNIQISLGKYIDKDYWERSTYITIITGDQLVDIQNWILDQWIPQNPIYSLFSAAKTNTQSDIFNPIFRPNICDTFCYSMLYYIANMNGGNLVDPTNTGRGLNVCIDYATVPNVTINTFIESDLLRPNGKIVPVDYESNRQDIVNFYTLFLAQATEIKDALVESGKLIQEIINNPDLDPDQKAALIRQILTDVFIILLSLKDIYEKFNIAYYYGYNSSNQPQYWKIYNPKIELLYQNSNLKRTVQGLDYLGNPVNDDFTQLKDCICNCDKTEYSPPIVVTPVVPPTMVSTNSISPFLIVLLIFIAIVVILAIILIIISAMSPD